MNAAKRATITDVARSAGVSVATVSKVVNGRYGVALATAERVRTVIEELGYSSSLVARSLRSARTGVIGILVAEFEPFSTELLKGLSAAASGSGYELIAWSGNSRGTERAGWERRSLDQLSGTLIDGAVIVTPTVVEDSYRIPVVALDPHSGSTTMPTVVSDNLDGARSAIRHLIATGHRRIGFLGGREDLESARAREEGYRLSLHEAGISFDPDLIRNGGFHPDTADGPAHELLLLEDRPTAVFAANDLTAIQLLRVAAELGISVPEQLSVIGFDNVPESALSTPQLTTVSQPLNEMGRRAMEMLLTLLRGETLEQSLVHLPTELVIRASSGPAPAPQTASRS